MSNRKLNKQHNVLMSDKKMAVSNQLSNTTQESDEAENIPKPLTEGSLLHFGQTGIHLKRFSFMHSHRFACTHTDTHSYSPSLVAGA